MQLNNTLTEYATTQGVHLQHCFSNDLHAHRMHFDMSKNAYSFDVTPGLLLGAKAPVMMPSGKDVSCLVASIGAKPADVRYDRVGTTYCIY